MRYCNRAIIAVLACLGASAPALAGAQRSTIASCAVENAQVSVSFNGMDPEVSAVRSRLDAKIAEVKSLVAEQHFTKVVLQSYTYSISTNYNSGETHFQYNGNISFAILPADKAVDFMELLAKKGYQTSVSVSSYNSGACSPQSER